MRWYLLMASLWAPNQPSALPTSVAPGEKVEIAVDMVAPPNPGAYRGYWELRNATGQIFGFGANADESIWVDIVVQGETYCGFADNYSGSEWNDRLAFPECRQSGCER